MKSLKLNKFTLNKPKKKQEFTLLLKNIGLFGEIHILFSKNALFFIKSTVKIFVMLQKISVHFNKCCSFEQTANQHIRMIYEGLF